MRARTTPIAHYAISSGPSDKKLRVIKQRIDNGEQPDGVAVRCTLKSEGVIKTRQSIIILGVPQIYEDGEFELVVSYDGERYEGRYNAVSTIGGYLDLIEE